MQNLRVSLPGVQRHTEIGREFSLNNARGEIPLQREITTDPDRLAGKQIRGNPFGRPGVFQKIALTCRPVVHGKQAVDVRRRRHNGNRAGNLRNPAGKTVCPSDMSGEQGNTKLCPVVHRHHRRIGQLGVYIWGNRAHGNPRCPYKDKQIGLCKRLSGKGVQIHLFLPKAGGHVCRIPVFLRQVCGNLLRQREAPPGKSDQRRFHISVPFRYPVVKAGS